MSPPSRRQIPIHLDKWIVTVREGKDLSRGDQRGSFFTKMSPFCELRLGGQGPFSTSVKPNTTHPSWDDSVEFEANGGGDDDDGLPQPGPKLSVVCYSRRGRHPTTASSSSTASSNAGRMEIGRAEVTLTADAGLGPKKVHRIPLLRRNAVGCQVAAGSVMLEYMLVPGIPLQSISMAASPEETADPPCEEAAAGVSAASRGDLRGGIGGGGGSGGGVRAYCMNELKKPARKPALLTLVGALIAAALAVRLSGFPELAPIPVPFKLTAGGHKGSSTHHIRLHEDGNVVVAIGPKPPPPATGAALLWQSGPLRSAPKTSSGSSGGGGGDACKKCHITVNKDGKVALVHGKEELATFWPPWAQAFFEVSDQR